MGRDQNVGRRLAKLKQDSMSKGENHILTRVPPGRSRERDTFGHDQVHVEKKALSGTKLINT